MYVLDQLSVAPNRRLWTLVDTTTNLPLLFPLLFLIDRLASRSESTQSSTLQALKFFYEYWYQKHDVTFCLSFQLSGYNPSIAVSELEAFLHYLESGKLMLPTLGYAVISKHNTNINHVHAVCRFINYLINTYVSPRIWMAPQKSFLVMLYNYPSVCRPIVLIFDPASKSIHTNILIALQQTWSGDFMRLLDQNRLSSQILLIPSLLEKFNSEII